MDSAYISSTIYALRAKGYLSFCSNDYNSCHYLLSNDRFDRTQNRTSLSKCCSCCEVSNLSPKVPYSLYGPRQSSLIHWSAYRKYLIFRGGDRISNYIYNCDNGYGFSQSYGIEKGCCCCKVSCCVNERLVCCSNSSGISGRTRRRRNEASFKCRCLVDEGNNGVSDSGFDDDTESLLSLLSEDLEAKRKVGAKVREKVRDRDWISGSYERVSREEKRERSGEGICECGKKNKKEQGDWNHGFEYREDGLRKSNGEEIGGAISRAENRRLRRESSECSSYYSVSSSGDFDDDSKVHDKHTLLAEETLSGYEYEDSRADEKDEHEHVFERKSKSEKIQNDRFSEEARLSGRESSHRRSQVLEIRGSGRDEILNSNERFSDTNKTSISAVNLDRQTGKRYLQSENKFGETSMSRKKSSEIKETQDFQRDDMRSTSQSRIRLGSTEENVEIAKDERRREDSYKIEEENIKRNTQQVGRISEVRDHDNQRISVLQSRAEIGAADAKRTSQPRIRLGSTEENVEIAKDERRIVVSHITEDENVMRNTQQIRRISEVQDRDTRRTSVSQSHAEIRTPYVDSMQHQKSQQDIQKANDGRRNSQQATRISEIYDTNIEKTSITQSQTNVSNQVNNTNLISVSYHGSSEPHPQTGQRLPQTQRVQSGRGFYDAENTSVVHASEMERTEDSRVTSETGVYQESEELSVGISVGNTRVRSNQSDTNLLPIRPRKELETASMSQEPLRLGFQKSSQTTVIPPRSQSLTRTSVRAELESGFESQKLSNPILKSGSSSAYTDHRRKPQALQEGSYKRTEIAEVPCEPNYHAAPEDALSSADRLQQSSAQFIEEFVEKARHEASSSSASEIRRTEEVSEAKLASEDDKKKDNKASSSGGSETIGPSAEMWHVSEPLVVKTPETEKFAEPTTTTITTTSATENAIVKRNGKSLWNVIADIVTLKWSSSEPTASAATSSRRRNPSNESAASEGWFSTHESDLSRSKNSKGSRSETKSDQLQVTELSTPTHGPELELLPGPVSQRVSLSGSENLGWNEDGRSSRASPSGMEIVELPSQLSIRGQSPTIISQVSDETTSPTEESTATEGSIGGELKRRKLQRIKQVPKDRFDEWEEAFTIEAEQRRLDEMFMREALLEANKAADTWEVPVGAVLVQNGKIIARGYNLVEELRDSTAHAEMICIREASNQLRSWRLADTTLYVTLEPCPMCAGAILQARIATLVWGAPNKLLGADGSWIRLFPDGGEGGGSNTEKPSPPPHPFHPNMNVRRGVLSSECAEIMQQFFQLRRKKKEKENPSTSSRLSITHPSKLLKKVHDVFHVMFCL